MYFPLNPFTRFFILLLAFMLLPLLAQAQQEAGSETSADSTAIVTMLDGSIYIGDIISQGEGRIRMLTENIGEIEIPLEKVRSIKIVGPERFFEGSYFFENPNATRYLFGPSAIPLRKGEGYYQNTYVILQMFNYGLTDFLSVGGGFDVITPFVGGTGPLFILTPKLGTQLTEKIHAGGGLLYANTLAADGFGGVGILYGVGTYGSRENNITAGLGWGFIEGDFDSRPIITVSGMMRASQRIGLVSENWFIPSDGYAGFISYGLRFMGERITVDFAFINSAEILEEILIGIPYIDFVVKFGKQ